MAEARLLGMDIGGTKCAVVLGTEEGRVLARRAFPTRCAERPPRAVLEELLAAASALCAEYEAKPLALGISCGGPLDSRRGLILSPPNLPGWDELPICAFFQERMGIPCYLQNDANACALAEWRFGAGQGCRNMIFLTFGTGLGAGMILDGRLYSGTNDLAGEVGHIRLSPTGPLGYGKEGSWEGYCSGGGIGRMAADAGGAGLDARAVCEAARAGEAWARAVLDESAERLGQGLALLVDVLNPERIVIGSVYARAEDLLARGARAALEREALPLAAGRCRVLPAALGEAIGDIAALCVALDGYKQEKENSVHE